MTRHVKDWTAVNSRWPLLHFLSVKVSDRAEHLGSGLLQKGLKPNPDTFIGIFAQNRPEVSADVTF